MGIKSGRKVCIKNYLRAYTKPVNATFVNEHLLNIHCAVIEFVRISSKKLIRPGMYSSILQICCALAQLKLLYIFDPPEVPSV